jgi:ligand-binding sensor domain-containing protein
MTSKLSNTIAFFLILFSLASTAENRNRYDNSELRFKHLQVEHGLSSNVTSCILQDSKGFLWFGTDAGLNRFDGFQIKTYESGKHQQNSLSNEVIKCIYEDTKGKIWIGTERGLNSYNPDNDQFRHFLSQKENIHSLSNNTITSIVEDKLNRIWVGTFNGLNQLTSFSKEGEPIFNRFNHDPQKQESISNDRIFCLTIDKSGNLWIGTEGGGLNLVKAEEITNKELNFIHFTHLKSDSLSIANNIIYNIYQINDGSIYVGTDNGLSIFQK